MSGRAIKLSEGSHGRVWPTLRRWACPLASLLMAGAVLWLRELSLLSVILLAFLLACPILAAWVVISTKRPWPYPIGVVPVTEGRTLDRVAPFYDLLCQIVGLGPGFRRRSVALAHLVPGEHVLDAGCGTGLLTLLAAEAVGRGGFAIGIDAAPDMVRMANENAAGTRSSARFKLAAIEALPFDDDSFDAVFVSLVLHLLPYELRHRALTEVRRVLKPNGRLLVVDIDPASSRLARGLVRLMRCRPASACDAVSSTPTLLCIAGFVPAQDLGRWGPMLAFWCAVKPACGEHHG